MLAGRNIFNAPDVIYSNERGRVQQYSDLRLDVELRDQGHLLSPPAPGSAVLLPPIRLAARAQERRAAAFSSFHPPHSIREDLPWF